MTTTYQFSIEELSADFIRKLKKFHQNGTVTLLVDTEDETDFLLQNPKNREVLLKSVAQAEAGNLTAVDFESLAKNL